MGTENQYPDYAPSVAGGGIMAALFAIEFCAHVFNLARKRTWWCLPLVIGALFEVVGYACRALGNKNPYSSGLYIIATLAILLAPILFAASVYMFLGRIIRSTGCESYSMIRTTWLTKIFVGGDISCFVIQAIGAVMITSNGGGNTKKLGKDIIMVGLVLQVVIFLFFLTVAVVFHKRMNSRGANTKVSSGFNWRQYITQLYIASVFITVRNIFRTVEYGMGTDGYILTHEWPLYVFDGTLMLLVLAISWFWSALGVIPTATASDSSSDDIEMGSGRRKRQSRAAPPGDFNTHFQNHQQQQGRHYQQR